MAVQDDKREVEMREIVGLRAGGRRSGTDAYLDFTAGGHRYSAPIELKSTTVGSVSTARDVGFDHIARWRSRVWLFGFYEPDGPTLENLLTLGPLDMEPWISRIERYMAPDFMLGERAAAKLGMDDLHVICGDKSAYTLEDAKALYKRQWTEDRYTSQMDLSDGYSPPRMLEIPRLRAQYLSDRGSTLNNPHIPKRFFLTFADRAIRTTVGRERLRRRVRETIRRATLENRELRRIAAANARRR